MNFQAVSVGQKLIEGNVSGGYLDNAGTASAALIDEIEFADAGIGQMISDLKNQHLFNSTLVIITAKHGQSPIDPLRVQKIKSSSPAHILHSFLPSSEDPTGPDIGPTEDDISLLWLSNSNLTKSAVAMLETHASAAGIGEIFSGPSITTMFYAPGVPPTGDPRTPDIIVQPNVGVIYTGSTSKQAEHGGFAHDDTNVMLLVSNPELDAKTVTTAVETAQVAPTVLNALGLDPKKLLAVQIEGTAVLPALFENESSGGH
jgi:arylsulfatase A-like enzyme